MEATISTKYQVVIPKNIRKAHGLKPGDKVVFTEDKNNQIILSSSPTANRSYEKALDKLAGSLQDTPWQQQGVDAAVWLRKERDSDR